MPLTPQEKDFCDHFDYESQDLSGGRPLPAHEWMKAHGVEEMDIWNILVLRERQRKTPIAEKPEQPFELAWESDEQAKGRNQELAKEADDVKRTGRTPHADD